MAVTSYDEYAVVLTANSNGVLTFSISALSLLAPEASGVSVSGSGTTPGILGDQANETFTRSGSAQSLTYAADTVGTLGLGSSGFIGKDTSGKYHLFVPSGVLSSITGSLVFNAVPNNPSDPATQWNVGAAAPAGPAAPVISTIADNVGPTQGNLSSGAVTDDSTLTLSGTAPAGTTVTVYNGTTVVGTATSNALTGAWTLTTSSLPNGPISLTAVANNLVGSSAASAAFTATVDTVAPGAPLIGSVVDDVAPGTGPLTSGASTNDTNLTVTLDLTGSGAKAGDTVRLYNGTGTGTPVGSVVTLTAANISANSVAVQTGTLTNNTTYQLTARITDQAGNQSGASSVFVVTEDATAVCYAAGTRIAVEGGEKPVESLQPGDLVLVKDGDAWAHRPVRWIGRRSIKLDQHPDPRLVEPIRVMRGAFADDVPHRDLVLSPDHAVLVDGVLIAVRQLVNGVTIRPETAVSSVEYFHIALDSHAILLAANLAAESYLDTGNRGFFSNGGEPVVLHPDLTDERPNVDRATGSCMPFVWAAERVQPVWQMLADRAHALDGHAAAKGAGLTDDPDLHLMMKGRVVRPLFAENGLYIFALPRDARRVRLLSRSTSPAEVKPWLDDRRRLGVNVERIVVRTPESLEEVPVDHPELKKGWWAVERAGTTMRRWTDGDAVLPLPPTATVTMLEVRVCASDLVYPAHDEPDEKTIAAA